MSTLTETVADKRAENFRDKILRKCGEKRRGDEAKVFRGVCEQIEKLSREMADRFSQGKKLLSMGNGGSLCDALHFAVEFTHPSSRNEPLIPPSR